MLGDMGWYSAQSRHNILDLKFWNRMCNLDLSRTTRKVFEWDLTFSNKIGSWSYYVHNLFESVGCSNVFNDVTPCDIPSAEII